MSYQYGQDEKYSTVARLIELCNDELALRPYLRNKNFTVRYCAKKLKLILVNERKKLGDE